jgi:hypothetical protein
MKGITLMIQRFKLTLAAMGLLFGFAFAFTAAVPAYAQFDPDCDGIENCLEGGAVATDPNAADTGTAAERVGTLITTVINIFSLVVGVISVIMIIIGGLKYITSGGDSANVTGAKNTILYAIIGLVVVALAQVIVRFVLERATTV